MIYLLIGIFLAILFLVFIYVKNYLTGFRMTGKIIIYICVLLFTISVVLHPEESYRSAAEGINMWFNVVFPSLLPFFIGSELMVSLGVVDILGILLEPVMRPVFNVPGEGSFPFVMSITSGYPVGAKIVGEMYNEKMCTKTEAQRLLSFCSTSGPLFMIGAVGIGMLNIKGTGIVIALAHYLGAVTVGIFFRYFNFGNKSVNNNIVKKERKRISDILKKERPPIGLLLSQAVKNSVNSVLTIGGFIVLFSVIIKLLYLSGIIDIIADIFYLLLSHIGFERSLMAPISGGIFEMTVGSKLIASSIAPLQQKVTAVCGIIAWSGFSIHAQVASMLSSTDLKISVYMVSKLFHSLISSLYSYLIISFFGIPYTFKSIETFAFNNDIIKRNPNFIQSLISGSKMFVYCIILLVLISILCRIITHQKKISQ